ncbi:MAG: SDR family oxidoreductase [Nocardioidaceae bacterium]
MTGPRPSRAVVVGATGQVGRTAVTALRSDGWEVVGTHHRRPARHTLATPPNAAGWARMLTDHPASAVVIAAALTDVDRCEDDPAVSRSVNVDLVDRVVRAAADHGAHVVHLSTDYVFDGTGGPYTERDPVRPINVYGRHKAESEQLILDHGGAVLRTSVVYGGSREGAVDHVAARLRQGPAAFSTEHFATPTWAPDLAWLVTRTVRERCGGIVHAAGPDHVSRHGLAIAIAQAAGLDPDRVLDSATTGASSARAPRPARCGLVVARAQELLGYRPAPLAEGLRRHFSGTGGHSSRR